METKNNKGLKSAFKRMSYLWVFCCSYHFILAQTVGVNDCLLCNTSNFIANRQNLLTYYNLNSYKAASNICEKKIVKLNIYYIQDNDGEKNFSSTGDGLGNSYNGKDFSNEMVFRLNTVYNTNSKLRVTPLNTIPIKNKDIQFMIEGVYYIKNSRLNLFTDTVNGWKKLTNNFNTHTFTENDYNNLAINKDSVLHLFIQGAGNFGKRFIIGLDTTFIFSQNLGGGGNGLCAGNYIYMESYGRYKDFKNGVYLGDQWSWVIDGENVVWAHEIGHSLGLAHTVLYGGGENCPSMKFGGSIDISCDDGIANSETPSTPYLTDTLNGPMHPGDRNNDTCLKYPQWWSNNLMDYHSENALSPMQIFLMHQNIKVTYPNWILTNSLNRTHNYCSWLKERISIYGNTVFLNKGCMQPLQIETKSVKNIYIKNNLEFFPNFEIFLGGELQVYMICN